eukprot:11204435-Lingulodinium_polyedra.AAC.1
MRPANAWGETAPGPAAQKRWAPGCRAKNRFGPTTCRKPTKKRRVSMNAVVATGLLQNTRQPTKSGR